jgi:hypothetical protein
MTDFDEDSVDSVNSEDVKLYVESATNHFERKTGDLALLSKLVQQHAAALYSSLVSAASSSRRPLPL